MDGWKLKLPKYDEFTSLKLKVGNWSQGQWRLYKDGKKEYKLKFDKDDYIISNKLAFDFYVANKKYISAYFKLKSEYQRLALNNPVQTRGAHQLKLATCLFFEWIVENGLFGVVLIVNSVHDELVVEAPKDKAEDARINLQRCMLEGGNHYLTNLKIKADAGIGQSWAEAK